VSSYLWYVEVEDSLAAMQQEDLIAAEPAVVALADVGQEVLDFSAAVDAAKVVGDAFEKRRVSLT
jgi:hypothetical protein